MSIMDRSLLFSDGQAITATAASTNLVDLGAHDITYPRDEGFGTQIPLVCTVTQTFNTLTSLTISIEMDDNAAFSSATTIWTSPAYLLADLAIGKKYLLPDYLPAGLTERYVRLKYTVAGSAPTLGKITAGVATGRQSAK